MSCADSYKSNSAAEQFAAAQSGDKAAFDSLVQQNLPLVKFIVKRFLGRGKEYDDLYQTGCIGLIKAIQKFDFGLNIRFSTYAVPLIMGEIRRLLRDDNAIHVSRSLHDLAVRINRYRQTYEKEEGYEPSLDEICIFAGVDKDLALLALNAAMPVKSLTEPIGGTQDLTLEDTIPGEDLAKFEDRLFLRDIMDTLDTTERAVIYARFFDRKTQKEVGERLGYTQVQISRMESKIIRKMRDLAGYRSQSIN